MPGTKKMPDGFAVVIPEETGIHWTYQGGGMSCTQHSIEGTLIPLGKQRRRRRLTLPWETRSANVSELSTEERVELVADEMSDSDLIGENTLTDFATGRNGFDMTRIDLEEFLCEKEYNLVDFRVRKRGHFISHAEYSAWKRNHTYRYAIGTYWDDYQKFAYGIWDNLDKDPRALWDSQSELFESLQENLPFNMEEAYEEYHRNADGRPAHSAVLKPVRLHAPDDMEPSTEPLTGETWVTNYDGEMAFFRVPNAD